MTNQTMTNEDKRRERLKNLTGLVLGVFVLTLSVVSWMALQGKA